MCWILPTKPNHLIFSHFFFKQSLLILDICNLLTVWFLWSSSKQRCCMAAGLNASVVPVHRWWHFAVNLPGEQIVLPHLVADSDSLVWSSCVLSELGLCSITSQNIPRYMFVFLVLTLKTARIKGINPSTRFLTLIMRKTSWHKSWTLSVLLHLMKYLILIVSLLVISSLAFIITPTLLLQWH